MIMEVEWVLGEQRLTDLIVTSGLRQVKVRRVAFDGEDDFAWADNASLHEQMVSSSYDQALQQGSTDPA